MGAVGIHPTAVDNSLQYRPQESPANSNIQDRAGDAGGILLGFARKCLVHSRLSGLLTQRPRHVKWDPVLLDMWTPTSGLCLQTLRCPLQRVKFKLAEALGDDLSQLVPRD